MCNCIETVDKFLSNVNTEVWCTCPVNSEDEGISKISRDFYKSQARHIEEFVAAYFEKTNLDPREAKLVSMQALTGKGLRIEYWFEPFALENKAEIEKLRLLLADVIELGNKIREEGATQEPFDNCPELLDKWDELVRKTIEYLKGGKEWIPEKENFSKLRQKIKKSS